MTSKKLTSFSIFQWKEQTQTQKTIAQKVKNEKQTKFILSFFFVKVQVKVIVKNTTTTTKKSSRKARVEKDIRKLPTSLDVQWCKTFSAGIFFVRFFSSSFLLFLLLLHCRFFIFFFVFLYSMLEDGFVPSSVILFCVCFRHCVDFFSCFFPPSLSPSLCDTFIEPERITCNELVGVIFRVVT